MVEIETLVRYTQPMTSEETQKALSIPEKNSIKDKMAITFLHALNSTVNYGMQETSRDFDGAGLDFILLSRTVGTKRTIASGANQINAQLKGVAISSTSMFEETETHITYTLSQDLVQFGLAMYLFIVVLPEDKDIESWRVINEANVLLNARGYYTRVENVLSRGKIKIPKTQQLTPETYKSLFQTPSNEVAS